MKTEDELIAEWLTTNKPKQFAEAEPVYQPYKGRLQPTNTITQLEIDYTTKKRVYTYLNRISLTESIDETTRNYGH